MRKIILVFIIVFSETLLYSQDLPIKFKANEKANPWIGKEWDFSYEELKSPINVEFDGKNLNMYYDTDKKFLETNVVRYEYKENKEYDKLKSKIYILETINKHGFTEYLLIEITYNFGDILYEIQLPFMDQKGIIMSYSRYQQFPVLIEIKIILTNILTT